MFFWRARPSRNRKDTNGRKRGQGLYVLIWAGLYVLMILTFSFDLLAGEG
jgi:cytochrome c oxidase subunit IV